MLDIVLDVCEFFPAHFPFPPGTQHISKLTDFFLEICLISLESQVTDKAWHIKDAQQLLPRTYPTFEKLPISSLWISQ